jgi:hypothetical protein
MQALRVALLLISIGFVVNGADAEKLGIAVIVIHVAVCALFVVLRLYDVYHKILRLCNAPKEVWFGCVVVAGSQWRWVVVLIPHLCVCMSFCADEARFKCGGGYARRRCRRYESIVVCFFVSIDAPVLSRYMSCVFCSHRFCAEPKSCAAAIGASATA